MVSLMGMNIPISEQSVFTLESRQAFHFSLKSSGRGSFATLIPFLQRKISV